jgi:hypothetical protein
MADHATFTRSIGSHERLRPVPGRRDTAHTSDSGDTHHLLEDEQHPAMQQCIARLVKSVVRISDISLHSGKYYSYQPDISSSPRDYKLTEAHADMLVLGHVFNDIDHALIEEKNAFPFGFNMANARIIDGQYVIFDVGDAYGNFWTPLRFNAPDEPVERKAFYNEYSPVVAAAFHGKIQTLRSFYGSKTGKRFFSAVLTSVSDTPHELFGPHPSGKVITQEGIYNQCMKRLRVAEQHARQRM